MGNTMKKNTTTTTTNNSNKKVLMNKTEIANLLGNTKVSKKIVKKQNKTGSIKFAFESYGRSWSRVHRGFNLTNHDTNGDFANYEREWLTLRNKMDKNQLHWFWAAYKRVMVVQATEPNASVRFFKNAAHRVWLARAVLKGTVKKNKDFCDAVRTDIKNRGKYGRSVYNLFA